MTTSHDDIQTLQAAYGRTLSAILGTEHPADLREHYRTALMKLPTAARTIYDHSGLRKASIITAVETVYYHFDANNRQAVANALELDYDVLMALLCGLIIGTGG